MNGWYTMRKTNDSGLVELVLLHALLPLDKMRYYDQARLLLLFFKANVRFRFTPLV